MSPEPSSGADPRFADRAARPMAEMFDDVSGRYDLLNRVMSLGQDGAWRAAMWAAVPEDAATVLDLCTGSGVSLRGLRRPGRLLLGADVSLRMLEVAAERERASGWGPRLACADAFRLPFRDGAVDAVTIAFGIRNLRPRDAALREIARVLSPGGTLAVLEAAAPGRSPTAPLHAFWLRRVVPLAGHLSPEPSAYAYLSRSIFEFGAGPEFERALADAGFALASVRGFLFGATKLWVAEKAPGEADRPAGVQVARARSDAPAATAAAAARREAEWRTWVGVQLALSVALAAALGYGLWVMLKSGPHLPLTGWQRDLALWLLAGGAIAFAARTLWLIAQWGRPAPRRTS